MTRMVLARRIAEILFNLNSEVWILVLVLVVVLVQSAFSPAKRARLSRNYFVQLARLSNIGILEDEGRRLLNFARVDIKLELEWLKQAASDPSFLFWRSAWWASLPKALLPH